MCFPGRLIILGRSEGPDPPVVQFPELELQSENPGIGNIPFFAALAPLATAAAADGLAPQVAAAGVFGLGPLPKAGNNSSDCTSNAGAPLVADLSAAGGEAGAGVGTGAGVACAEVEAVAGASGFPSFTNDEGGGCLISSSSWASSTVTLWAASAVCFAASMAARDPLALDASEAMMNCSRGNQVPEGRE